MTRPIHGRALAAQFANWRYPCIVGWLCLLVGCGASDPALDVLNDYEVRVFRTLELSSPDEPSPALVPWPRTRDRVLPVPSRSMDLLDLLPLAECGLGPLVAERNAQLGRVQAASQRLRHELQFLDGATRCLAAPPTGLNPGFVADLGRIVELKRGDLEIAYWNATIADEALASSFSATARLLPLGARGSGREATGAIHRWVDLDAEQAKASTAEWEEPWQHLSRDEFGGALRRSLVAAERALVRVAQALRTADARRPICPLGTPTPRARVLREVFSSRYAEKVQPWIAAVDSEAMHWFDALERLWEAQQAPVPAGLAQRLAPILLAREQGSEYRAFAAARQSHTEAWQDFFRRCGMQPGR